jgi:hypothetical protein
MDGPLFSDIELSAEPILKWFAFGHLSSPRRELSERFAQLARVLVDQLLPSEERRVALRKLLECKDAAVRAVSA